MMPFGQELESIQRWFQNVITHPDGVTPGLASAATSEHFEVDSATVERIVLPSRRQSSVERLQIYGNAYYARLIDCLRSQFPAVRNSIGDEAFNGLAFGYLVEHPSSNYSVSSLGNSFDAFLAKTRPERDGSQAPGQLDFADFLLDLARLERIYGEVFDGPGPERSPSVASQEFADLTADEFVDCRLQLHQCVRLLEFSFPVHDYSSAVRRGIEPPQIEARSVRLVVTRRDYVVRRYELNPSQFALLSALEGGDTIGESLIRANQARQDQPTLSLTASNLQAWFREWSSAPLFAAVVKKVSSLGNAQVG